jgi:hypothetical protein
MKVRKTNLWIILALFSLGAAGAKADTQYLTDATPIIGGFGMGGLETNTLAANSTFTNAGQSASAYADISTGTMGVESSGDVPTTFGMINDAAEAFMGDTITVAGTTGLLNLGLDLTVDGSSLLSDPTQNLTFVGVYAFAPGTFDTSDFTAPGQVLFSEGFVMGPGTMPYASYFSQFGLTYGGSYGTGTQNIPLNIPFSTLGSNFQLLISLETYEDGSTLTGNDWDSDYYHTLTASLVAPAGVTLTSASGAFPGTSAVPEPKTVAVLIGGLLIMIYSKRRHECRRGTQECVRHGG